MLISPLSLSTETNPTSMIVSETKTAKNSPTGTPHSTSKNSLLKLKPKLTANYRTKQKIWTIRLTLRIQTSLERI